MAYKHSQPGDPIFDRHTRAALAGSARSIAWLSTRGWSVGQAAAMEDHMAHKRKNAGRARASFRILRRGNPAATLTVFGKSRKAAERLGKRILGNIAAGFHDDAGVFHPLRASFDYDPSRVGERGKKKKRRR